MRVTNIRRDKFLIVILTLLIGVVFKGKSQDILKLTVNDAIKIAQEHSHESTINIKTYKIKECDFIDYTKNKLPKMRLSLQPGSYGRSIQEQWSSKTEVFEPVQVQRMSSLANVSVFQPVKFLGGGVSVSSEIRRNQTFSSSGENLYFVSTPINISYKLNFSEINKYKWADRIEPKKMFEAKKRLIEANEKIAISALEYFFNVLIAEVNLNIALLNLEHAESYLLKANKMIEVKSISLPEYLKIKLKLSNAQIKVQTERIIRENERLELCNFLGLPQNTYLECTIPMPLKIAKIDQELALARFKKHNPDIIKSSRNIIESQRELAKAKAQVYDIDIKTSIGLNQNKEYLPLAYQDLLDRQSVSVSVNMPIMNWGEIRRNISKAQLNKEITEIETINNARNIELKLIKKIKEFNITKEQVESLAQADTLAMYIYNSTQKRFIIGKATILDINDSERELQRARNNYMNQLKSQWIQYFIIRQLCLYDFDNDIDIKSKIK